MYAQLTRDFFCMSRRVPVFNVGAGDMTSIAFTKLTRKVDDTSLDMDFETLDKTKLRQ